MEGGGRSGRVRGRSDRFVDGWDGGNVYISVRKNSGMKHHVVACWNCAYGTYDTMQISNNCNLRQSGDRVSWR